MLEQTKALVLIGQDLAVLEGKVEESASERGYFLIEALCNGRACCFKGKIICGERLGRIAEHVPRKLIEQDQISQAAERPVLPVHQRTCDCLLVHGNEASENFSVESRRLGKPALLECLRDVKEVGAEPEAQDLRCARVRSKDESCVRHAAGY